MSTELSPRPALPLGWYYPDAENTQALDAKFQRELPAGHPLDGVPVEVFAWREGATDDVLFRHRNRTDRFTVVHLSWLGRTEINAQHPTVEFDGTFAEFLAEEERLYGLTPPTAKTATPNQATAVNAPVAPWFHFGHYWRRVTE